MNVLVTGIIAITCLGILPAQAALPPPETYGFFGGLAGQMTITSTGAVTGKMDLLNTTTWQTGDPQTGEHIYTASVLTPFSGQFLRSGRASITTYISPQGAYQGRLYISMELDKFSEETVIHGTYQGNSGSFDYTLGYFHAYPVAAAGSRAGSYTAAFRPASAGGPAGDRTATGSMMISPRPATPYGAEN